MDCDAIIVGAGFAGAAAAVALAQSGKTSIILEARDRVGGRALSRAFPGGPMVEFGGAWITPWQSRIRTHAEAHGVALRPTHPVSEHRFHDGRSLRAGLPCAKDEMPAYRRTMEQIRADTEAYEAGDKSKGPITLSAYLEWIEASPEARMQIMAWWTISGNGDPAVISAAEFLSSCGYGGGSPEGMLGALRHTLDPGAAILVERMIEASGTKLRLNAPVQSLSQTATGVTVNGISARHAIVCVPLNVLSAIAFTPPLPKRQAEAAAIGHGGIALKLWIRARGVKPGTLATGGEGHLKWMFAERETGDGTTLIVAFGLAAAAFDPCDRDTVASELKRFFPEADYVTHDFHDWLRDPWAKGTWVATPANAPWIADHATWSAHGRVQFATSDFSPQNPGWFEAAIVAGEAAATNLLE